MGKSPAQTADSKRRGRRAAPDLRDDGHPNSLALGLPDPQAGAAKLPAMTRRILPTVLRLGATILLLTLAASALGEALDVAVVVEVTPEGKRITRPNRERPVYCVLMPPLLKADGIDLKPEPEPAAPDVDLLISQALAGQGYLSATRQAQPSLLLAFTWGSTVPRWVRRQPVNASATQQLVGGNIFGKIILTGTPEALLMAQAAHPRYLLMISAFDYPEWLQHRKMRLLWTAHVSARNRNHTFPQVLPVLLTAVADKLGRETPDPVFELFQLARS